MAYDPHKAPKRVLLCAVRFLARGFGPTYEPRPSGGGFRAFARQIARAQGPTPAELDKAERELLKAGHLEKTKGTHPELRLTEKGREVSQSQCRGVSLAPWDAALTFPRGRRQVSIAGTSRRRKRR